MTKDNGLERPWPRIIYNHDGENAYWPIWLWPRMHDPTRWPVSQQEFLGWAIEDWCDSSVDAFFWNPGSCTVYTIPLESGEPYGIRHPADITVDMERLTRGEGSFSSALLRELGNAVVIQCRKFWAEGTDDLTMVIDAGHRRKKGVYASFRMNDAHFQHDGYEYLWCQFNRDHPELNQNDPRTLPDYVHPEVRRWRLSHIEEVCTKWDIDGIELDWYRNPDLFGDKPWQKAGVLNEFMQQVRQVATDCAARRGRPIAVAARTPENLEISMACGIDLRTWLAKGCVDLLVVGAGIFTMDYPTEEVLAVAHTHGIPVYACLNYYRAEPVVWAWAANAYQKGFDGLYLFNWMTTEAYRNLERPLLRQLDGPDSCRDKSKLYMAEKLHPWYEENNKGHLVWRPALPLPMSFSNGPLCFGIRASEHRDDLDQARVVLRLVIDGQPEIENLAVTLNGVSLDPAGDYCSPDRDALRASEELYGRQAAYGGDHSQVHPPTITFEVASGDLFSGVNRVVVRGEPKGGDPMLREAQLFVDYSCTSPLTA